MVEDSIHVESLRRLPPRNVRIVGGNRVSLRKETITPHVTAPYQYIPDDGVVLEPPSINGDKR